MTARQAWKAKINSIGKTSGFSIVAVIVVSFFCASCSTFPTYSEEFIIDYTDPEHIDKVLATAPDKISKEQFYQSEFAIISGFSGSGGYFLEEPEIEWLRKAENVLKAKGIKLKDEYNRRFVFANSYLNNEKYDKALEEFSEIKYQHGIELAEWFISNAGIKNGIVRIKEYPGRIPCKASENTRAEDRNYLFVSYFKDAIYRYDKKRNKHAIIYAPEDNYEWCDALAFDGKELVIKLRFDGGIFIFNNSTSEIARLERQD